ncbi:hypothetical protein KBD45_00860 [Candidatus Dojkabacteria bacterium]|nr:hypothetical protein [Candidatus Dojkabacteria bacterium]
MESLTTYLDRTKSWGMGIKLSADGLTVLSDFLGNILSRPELSRFHKVTGQILPDTNYFVRILSRWSGDSQVTKWLSALELFIDEDNRVGWNCYDKRIGPISGKKMISPSPKYWLNKISVHSTQRCEQCSASTDCPLAHIARVHSEWGARRRNDTLAANPFGGFSDEELKLIECLGIENQADIEHGMPIGGTQSESGGYVVGLNYRGAFLRVIGDITMLIGTEGFLMGDTYSYNKPDAAKRTMAATTTVNQAIGRAVCLENGDNSVVLERGCSSDCYFYQLGCRLSRFHDSKNILSSSNV